MFSTRRTGDDKGLAEASQFDQMMQSMAEGSYPNPNLESMPVWYGVTLYIHVETQKLENLLNFESREK